MKKYIFKFFTVVLAAVTLFSFHCLTINDVKANESEKHQPYKELSIQLMPEYVTPTDWPEGEPAVLYGEHGLFVNEEEEPFEGSFSVNIPLDDPTFSLSIVAQILEEDSIDEEYTINEDEQKVVWTPKNPIEPGEEYRYVVEYYYSPFESKENKAFTYEQVVDRDVENMSFLFFEPVEAENLQLSIEPQNVLDMFGTPVHEYEFADVKAGEKFELDISYEKDSEITTAEALEQQTPPDDDVHQGLGMDDNANEGGSGGLISNEGAVMISISIIIAGLFIFFGLKNKEKKVQDDKPKPSKPKKPKKSNAEAKKQLRQQLVNGDIDEQTYKKRLSKLS